MKKIAMLVLFVVCGICTHAQQLSQVTFSGASTLTYFSFVTDGNVLIRISSDGKVMEWGTEEQSLRIPNYYAPKLLGYPGRVDYYGPETDSAARGKVQTIGSARITYYGTGSLRYQLGKIRTIGSQMFDYYTNFDNEAIAGKIKSMGVNQVSYYAGYDNAAYAGKLKAVGNTAITYYSSFDDKLIKGKLKSIGNVNYSWYTSLDAAGYGGGLKSGLMRQPVNGVTYILY
ncbi:MAG: hypothetical protein ABIX01_08690 [Chitinophagaceae bacterium]